MNKNTKALLKLLELDKDPLATLKDANRMREWIGSFNQIAYGVNPFEVKDEFKPLDEEGAEAEPDEVETDKEGANDWSKIHNE